MGFKVLSTDILYVLPNSIRLIPIAYFLFVFYLYANPDLFMDAFGIDVNPREHNLFWLLSLIYWTSFISSTASSLLTRSNAIKDESTQEIIQQYLKLRPLSANLESERALKWEILTQNVNEFVHTDLKTFNKAVMKRFNFTPVEIENFINELIKDYSSSDKKIDQNLELNKLVVKLIEAHFKDTSVITSN